MHYSCQKHEDISNKRKSESVTVILRVTLGTFGQHPAIS